MIYIETLDDASPFVESVLGRDCWTDVDLGWVKCPGCDRHATAASPNDCKVFVNPGGAPRLHCFHQSCAEKVADANRKISDAVFEKVADDIRQKFKPSSEQKETTAERRIWTAKTKVIKNRVLGEDAWTLDQVLQDSPEPVDTNPANHWKQIIGLFGDDDVIWAGGLYDSGSPKNVDNFQTKSDWLKVATPPGQFICPSVFKRMAYSRSVKNVELRRFLIVESDVLTKDQMASVFRWLMLTCGLHLVAVVDTAGKSIHGWFQVPDQALENRLKIVLPALECDRAMFLPTQVCRLPGAMRNGNYQRLLYLDRLAVNSHCNPDMILPLPEIYYDGVGTKWFIPNRSGWISGCERDAKRYLEEAGYQDESCSWSLLTDIENAVYRIQQGQAIHYAAPLAGYHAGLHDMGERKILVTSSPVLITPALGNFPTLKGLMETMFGPALPYWYGWCHVALRMFYDKTWSAGQVIALAGPVNAGKSLLQTLVTKMFGGRDADPFKFMTDRTNFNGDLFRAEHLKMEDKAESSDIKTRRHFASLIKQIAVNRSFACERKNSDELLLTPLRRMTISLNDEPERLQVLPPIDPDIQDKMMLFKVAPCAVPEGEEKKRKFMRDLVDELPAFIEFLLNWTIAPEYSHPRTGVKSHCDPNLLAALVRFDPEETLLELIDDQILNIQTQKGEPWRGRTRNLIEKLTAKDNSSAKEAQRLLSSAAACGRYLARLASKYPDRFEKVSVDHYEIWTIYSVDGKAAYEAAHSKPARHAADRLNGRLKGSCPLT